MRIEPLLIVALIGYLVAALAPTLSRFTKQWTGWLIAIYPLSVFIYFLNFLPTINKGDVVERSVPWVPSLGVNFDFYVDGLSLMMALLVSGIGVLVAIYAQGYLDDDAQIGRFYLYLLTFMSAMLGLVISGNLITLFIFWEITSISSYLLIGYKHTYESSRDAALQALLITGSGGLALLAGLILVGMMGGTTQIAQLVGPDSSLGGDPLYLGAFILVLIGCVTKSAQVPFHTWLPGAMAAPTPVSAYLHSATMVKAGIFLLARLSPALAGTNAWFYGVSGFGALTMLIGAYLSWQNSDLKKILAYATISVLGTLMLLLGLGGEGEHYAVEATVVFLLAHAFYKGSMFMIAGAIDHSTGTREIDQLSGLRKPLPFLFVATIIAALSMGGLPLLLGFIGKELLYEATLHTRANWIVVMTALAVVSNAMVGAAAALVTIKPFLGKELKPAHPHKPSWALRLGPIVLSLFSVGFGLMPGVLDKFVGAVASAISAETLTPHLKIWHGLNTALGLSTITVLLAAAVYLLRPRLLAPLLFLRGDKWGPQKWYEWGLEGMRTFAAKVTTILQNGNLRYYLMTITSALVIFAGGTLLSRGIALPLKLDYADIGIIEFVACLIIILSAMFATRFESRLAAIAALGGVGFGMSLLFMLLGAPDLAMTQISIEILAVVLIALIMGRLPYFLTSISMTDRTLTTFIAGMVGILVTFLVILATENSVPSLLTPYFTENSYELAKGRNIVNVILVDFRGFDTLGEITVLAIAGMGVLALATARAVRKKGQVAQQGEQN